MNNTIDIDSEFRVKKSFGAFTLQQYKEVNAGTDKARMDWIDQGYHGSMSSALRGYVRHSLDSLNSIADMIAQLKHIETSVMKAK